MRPLALLPLLLLPACKHDETCSCYEGTHWTPGHQAFRDATADWGLDVLDAEGIRIIAVDFDGDGWTDLALRKGGEPDDFSEGGERHTWLLRNTGHGSFEDVTQESGIRQNRHSDDPATGRPGEAWAFGDVDNDGDLDVVTCVQDDSDQYGETSEILLNDGSGHFELGPVSDIQYDGDTLPTAVTFVDADLDGFLDVWMPEYGYQDRLYLGDGTGAFTDVTHEVGLTTRPWTDAETINQGLAYSIAWSSAACDLNNDGWPELLASSYGRAPNHLWLALGDGQYENRSVASGYAYDDRMDWTDNESARCWCQLHPDDEDCEGVPPPEYITCNSDDDAFRWNHETDREPYRLGGNTGTTICADVDNDGWMDLVTTEIVHWDVGSSSDPSELLVNTHDPEVVFERPGNEVTGLTREHDRIDWNDGDMTGSVFDFDNDGWPDVYIGSSDYPGTRGWLWHQVEPDRFEPVPIEDGIDQHRSHGIAVADFDRDGDLDVVVGHGYARCDDDCYDTFNVRLFENVTGEDEGVRGNFIQLHLLGTGGTNRAAIGARVEVTAGGVTQVQEVGGGYGQAGYQNDLVLHFGLGTACEAEVSVRWPDRELDTETFTLEGGHRYLLEQGQEPVLEDLEEEE